MLLLLDTMSTTDVEYLLVGALVVIVAVSSNGCPCRQQSDFVSQRCSKCLIRAVVV